MVARSSPSDKLLLALAETSREDARRVGERAPGARLETEKDLLLPGYWDEWIERLGREGRREVVGVTGDGMNDAPALRAADVGLSMGVTGTDVAKEASDIIIMDDNFKSTVMAALGPQRLRQHPQVLAVPTQRQRRRVKLTLLAAAYGLEPPLNAVMMLWVNLIMDTMGALALGTEAPDAALLDRPPYKRDAPLISRAAAQRARAVRLPARRAARAAALRGGHARAGLRRRRQGQRQALHDRLQRLRALPGLQRVQREHHLRRQRAQGHPQELHVPRHRGPTLGAQYGIVTYGGDFTKTAPLTLEEWKTCAAIAAVTVPLGILMRFLPVSEDPSTFATEKPPAKRQRSAAERWATSRRRGRRRRAGGARRLVPEERLRGLVFARRGALQQVESQLEGYPGGRGAAGSAGRAARTATWAHRPREQKKVGEFLTRVFRRPPGGGPPGRNKRSGEKDRKVNSPKEILRNSDNRVALARLRLFKLFLPFDFFPPIFSRLHTTIFLLFLFLVLFRRFSDGRRAEKGAAATLASDRERSGQAALERQRHAGDPGCSGARRTT